MISNACLEDDHHLCTFGPCSCPCHIESGQNLLRQMGELFFIILLFSGCFTAPKTPWELERWINQNLPYERDFFDCRHRAEFAYRKLKDEWHCKDVKYIIRAVPGTFQNHAFVKYDCTNIGGGAGKILDIRDDAKRW